MTYLSVKQVSQIWGISERRVRKCCEEGSVSGAVKTGGVWLIPSGASLPQDRRYKSRKTAVIVCSSAEAGALTVKEFENKGYRAILVSNEDCTDKKIEYYKCPLDEESIKNVFEKIDNISSLVIFPSSYLPGNIDNTSEQDFDYYANLIFKHTYLVVKHAIAKVRKVKGNVLLVHSSVALNAEPAAPVYCMLQAGLVMLGKALALAEGTNKVRVNNLAIGPATTDQLMKTIGRAQIKKWRDVNPLGVSFRFEDCLKAICFLAIDNPSSKKMTGCVMTIDGGESIADAYTPNRREEL